MNRFPKRTLILMILALLAFLWMWIQTRRLHVQPAGDQRRPVQAQPVPK